jgi:NAD(P)-dependent dehydrogenase (short-subunit alcohol dehydrogenase family)
MKLANQTVLVIGGSSGMGLAIARLALNEGAKIIISARSREKLQQAAKSLGGSVRAIPVDTTDEESIKALFTEAGPINHLLIPGSALRLGNWREQPVADIQFSLQGKFIGPFLCARSAHFGPGSSLTFWSGIISRKPARNDALLAAVNAAVEAMTRALAKDLAPVRVNCISPGMVEGTGAYEAMPEESRRQMYEGIAARLPVGRVGTAEDIATLAIEVITNGFITGTVIDVDGGGMVA